MDYHGRSVQDGLGPKDVYVDLGAERVIAAEKGNERIAVEVKNFLGPSEIRELELAIGQYVFYRSLIKRFEPERRLVLAIPKAVFENLFQDPIARPPLDDLALELAVFDPRKERIIRWIK